MYIDEVKVDFIAIHRFKTTGGIWVDCPRGAHHLGSPENWGTSLADCAQCQHYVSAVVGSVVCAPYDAVRKTGFEAFFVKWLEKLDLNKMARR